MRRMHRSYPRQRRVPKAQVRRTESTKLLGNCSATTCLNILVLISVSADSRALRRRLYLHPPVGAFRSFFGTRIIPNSANERTWPAEAEYPQRPFKKSCQLGPTLVLLRRYIMARRTASGASSPLPSLTHTLTTPSTAWPSPPSFSLSSPPRSAACARKSQSGASKDRRSSRRRERVPPPSRSTHPSRRRRTPPTTNGYWTRRRYRTPRRRISSPLRFLWTRAMYPACRYRRAALFMDSQLRCPLSPSAVSTIPSSASVLGRGELVFRTDKMAYRCLDMISWSERVSMLGNFS